MPPRDDEQILVDARAAIARVIGQLQRDRDALAGKPQYAAGAERASTALAAAVRLSDALQLPSPEHP